MDFSIVTKAKSAFKAAAAKAEQAFVDIKSDLKGDFGNWSSSAATSPAAIPIGEGDLPWVGKTEHEKKHEAEFKERILEISKRPVDYLLKHYDEALLVDMRAAMSSAGAVLEADEELRRLRFQLVPKVMREQEFWRRYFIAVKRIKQEILARDSQQQQQQQQEEEEAHADGHDSASPAAGAAGSESPQKDPSEEDEYELAFQSVAIAPTMVLRRLAHAIDLARSARTMQELTTLEAESLDRQAADKWTKLMDAGIAKLNVLSAGKEKSKKKKREQQQQQQQQAKGGSLGDYYALLWSLFDAEMSQEDFAEEGEEAGAAGEGGAAAAGGEGGGARGGEPGASGRQQHAPPDIVKEINGAPPDSFVAQLAEIMAGIKSEQKMAVFWLEVVKELRRRWQERLFIPRMPHDASPDLRTCLLHQQLQLVNCCTARRLRRLTALSDLAEATATPAHGSGPAPLPPSSSSSSSSAPPGAPAAGPAPAEVAGAAAADGRAGRDVHEVHEIGGEAAGGGAGAAEAAGDEGAAGVEGGSASEKGETETPAADQQQRRDEGAQQRIGEGGSDREAAEEEDAAAPESPSTPGRPSRGWPKDPLFARLRDGTLAQRLGAAQPVPGLALLETSEPLYAPVSQDGPVLTEVFIRETEELILRTGRQAANPGCIVEDFVRWYSPLDWAADPQSPAPGAPPFEPTVTDVGEAEPDKEDAPQRAHGFLSARMQAQGFALAQRSAQAQHDPLAVTLQECCPFVASTCTRGMSAAKLERLCQMYELMETSVHLQPTGPAKAPSVQADPSSALPETETSALPKTAAGAAATAEAGSESDAPQSAAAASEERDAMEEQPAGSSSGFSDVKKDLIGKLENATIAAREEEEEQEEDLPEVATRDGAKGAGEGKRGGEEEEAEGRDARAEKEELGLGEGDSITGTPGDVKSAPVDSTEDHKEVKGSVKEGPVDEWTMI
eukprot:jgi/Mesen1/2111/ME000151S01377